MKYFRGLYTIGILVLGVLSPEFLKAQERHRVTRAVDELLTDYARNPRSAAGADIMAMLLYHKDYPAANVEALLRGLERVALAGTSQEGRANAAGLLVWSSSRYAPDPIPGSFARIERVFRRTNDHFVRSVVGGWAGSLALAERRGALVLLERVAAEDSYLAPKALASLLDMGEEGRIVLKRLHESKAVRNLRARGDLEAIAQYDYRPGRNTPGEK